MTLEESKKSLKLKGYCDFELKDFNEEFYNLFESLNFISEPIKTLFVWFKL